MTDDLVARLTALAESDRIGGFYEMAELHQRAADRLVQQAEALGQEPTAAEIKRVALALCQNNGTSWGMCHHRARGNYRAAARAAIHALRDVP